MSRCRSAIASARPISAAARWVSQETPGRIGARSWRGLNREEREDLARHILRIRHELRIAMIRVEHDMQMVADLVDRILVLDRGAVIAEGPPQER
jgi:ABC-type Na+ transport system ATPase subunit NatA